MSRTHARAIPLGQSSINCNSRVRAAWCDPHPLQHHDARGECNDTKDLLLHNGHRHFGVPLAVHRAGTGQPPAACVRGQLYARGGKHHFQLRLCLFHPLVGQREEARRLHQHLRVGQHHLFHHHVHSDWDHGRDRLQSGPRQFPLCRIQPLLSQHHQDIRLCLCVWDDRAGHPLQQHRHKIQPPGRQGLRPQVGHLLVRRFPLGGQLALLW
mmetsp:Transcript_17234/g.41789  ORF Transcript_17234/g.41789 Transcript_17234/m.41789 type:complete len:211 (-) Transcript_17234:720-1352(-)